MSSVEPVSNPTGEASDEASRVRENRHSSIAPEHQPADSNEDAIYKAVFENSVVGMARVAFADARWLDVNQAVCDLLGRTKEEMLRIPWPEMTHPDDLDLDLIQFRQMSEGRLEQYSVEKRFIHKDGHSIWARLTLSLVRDAKGRPDYEIAIVEDITERKETEERMQSSETQLRSILENLSEGLMLFDNNQNLIYQNPASLRIHGFAPEEPGRLDHDHLPQTWEAWDESGNPIPFEQWPVSRVFRGERFSDQVLHVRRVETGQEFFGSYNGSPIFDSNGQIKLGFITIRDITESKSIQSQLEIKEAKLQAILESTPTGIIVVNDRGEIEYMNRADQSLWGRSLRGETGELNYDAYQGWWVDSGKRVEPSEWACAKAFTTGRPVHPSRVRIKTPEGKEKYIYAAANPILGKNAEVLGSVGSDQEITDLVRTEQEIEKNRERLSLAVNYARVGFYDWDLKTNHLVFSDEMMRDWGIVPGTYAETIEAVLTIIHPDDRERVSEMIDRAMHGREPYDIEYRVVHPDGKVFWVEVHGNVTYDEDGTPARFFGTSVNITDRKLALEALKESEEKFRTFSEAMPQMAFIADPIGTITFFNRRHYEYFGVEKGKTEGWACKETQIHHPDDLQRTVQTWTRAIQTGEPYEIEYRLRRHDGQFRWHLGRAVPIRDHEGRITQWLGTNTDIHESKMASENLAKSEAKLRTVLSRIPIGIAIADPEGRFFEMNDACKEIWGLAGAVKSVREYERLESYDVQSGTRIPAHQSGMARALQKNEIVLNELLRIRSVDGRWKVVRHSAVPAKTESGELAGAIVVLQDVSEEMAAAEEIKRSKEDADRANLAKSQFLANMSHEIRTPVGAIVGFADLLKNAANETDRRSFTKIIERNSQQLLRLIDDILDLSKVEAGKLAIEKTNFSLPDFLAEFASVMAFKATEKGVPFNLRLSGLIPECICSDQTRLRQILTNLVGNAIKFTEKGHVDLTVSASEEDSLEFVIEDTGVGIAEAQRKKLFQAFSQADTSTTRKFGGTGLGLVLSRRLAEALGGSINLDWSEVNKGSRFFARLKYTPVKGARRVDQGSISILGSKARPDPDERTPLNGMRVLVVEDSPDNRTLIATYLRKTGAEVIMAEDGCQGVEKARAEDPNVILMDIQMPRLDGHEAMRQLRAEGFAKPIVALTAHAMKEERDRCFKSGCTDYLTKPLQKDRLVEVLSQYLPV